MWCIDSTLQVEVGKADVEGTGHLLTGLTWRRVVDAGGGRDVRSGHRSECVVTAVMRPPATW